MPDVMQEFVRETMEIMLKEWPVEKRLEGLTVEQRLAGLSTEQLRQLQETLARRLKANGSSMQPPQ